MACCRVMGKPTQFVTMTTNPKWAEIQENLLPGQTAINRPDIVSRVFALKLKQLLHDLDVGKFFGAIDAMVHVVEYQKRGLPHAHILLILKADDGAALFAPSMIVTAVQYYSAVKQTSVIGQGLSFHAFRSLSLTPRGARPLP